MNSYEEFLCFIFCLVKQTVDLYRGMKDIWAKNLKGILINFEPESIK